MKDCFVEQSLYIPGQVSQYSKQTVSQFIVSELTGHRRRPLKSPSHPTLLSNKLGIREISMKMNVVNHRARALSAAPSSTQIEQEEEMTRRGVQISHTKEEG